MTELKYIYLAFISYLFGGLKNFVEGRFSKGYNMVGAGWRTSVYLSNNLRRGTDRRPTGTRRSGCIGRVQVDSLLARY